MHPDIKKVIFHPPSEERKPGIHLLVKKLAIQHYEKRNNPNHTISKANV